MIIVRTKSTLAMLKHIRESIHDGSIETWIEDREGDFTHNTMQWRNRAWFHAVRYNGDRIEFRIVCTRQRPINRVEYAVYHGRFVEMLLTHCQRFIREIECSPRAIENKDRVIPKNYGRDSDED